MNKTPDENSVAALAKAYENRPVIRSLLQLIPGWGSLDTLLLHRAQELTNHRLRIFFNQLAENDTLLTREVIDSNDFLHCYFCTLRAVTHTRRAEKIRFFAQLLLSNAQGSFSETEDYEELLSILDSISHREFTVLTILKSYEEKYPQSSDQNILQRTQHYWRQFESDCINTQAIRPEEFSGFMTRIERSGLYREITGTYFGYLGGMGTTTPIFGRLLKLITKS